MKEQEESKTGEGTDMLFYYKATVQLVCVELFAGYRH